MEKILFNCMDYAKNFSFSSPNIIMMGSTGLGKTHLSLAIARAVIDKGFGVVYGSVNNLIDKLEREHFGRDEESSTRQSLMDCDLLILDDLGTEFRTCLLYTSTPGTGSSTVRLPNGETAVKRIPSPRRSTCSAR